MAPAVFITRSRPSPTVRAAICRCRPRAISAPISSIPRTPAPGSSTIISSPRPTPGSRICATNRTLCAAPGIPEGFAARGHFRGQGRWGGGWQVGGADSARPAPPQTRATYLLEVVLRTLTLGHPLHRRHGRLERSLGGRPLDRRRAGGGAERRDRTARRGGSLVPLRQCLHAGPRRQPDRPAESAGHFHAALQPPDPTWRRPGRSLQFHGSGGSGPVRSRSRCRCGTGSSTRSISTTYTEPTMHRARRFKSPMIFRSRPSPRTASDSPFEGAIVHPRVAEPQLSRCPSGSAGMTMASASFGGRQGKRERRIDPGAEAFAQVEKLGRPDGPLNLARVFLKEGRLEEATAALQRATRFEPAPPRWTLAWLNGLVNKQNGLPRPCHRRFPQRARGSLPRARSPRV
jgi:hypothetical protein